MTFTVLPAVDVAGGLAVRLVRGTTDTDPEPDTVAGDPLNTALAWQAEGAEWIHLVDLDAAFNRGSNAGLLAAVVGALDVKVELSGGVADDASLTQALATGCERVILSTGALGNTTWCERAIAEHGERIAVGLDVQVSDQLGDSRQHRLAARGSTDSGGDLWDTLSWLDHAGCARYVVTDVNADGMLRGPNMELYRAVTGATAMPVIASGGISTIDDLAELAEVSVGASNLEGSIVGKALYAGRFTLAEALEAMRHA